VNVAAQTADEIILKYIKTVGGMEDSNREGYPSHRQGDRRWRF
jgi:hypothetical protein